MKTNSEQHSAVPHITIIASLALAIICSASLSQFCSLSVTVTVSLFHALTLSPTHSPPLTNILPPLPSLQLPPVSLPQTEKMQAYAASLACPVGAIRLKVPDPLMKKVLEIFPAEVSW